MNSLAHYLITEPPVEMASKPGEDDKKIRNLLNALVPGSSISVDEFKSIRTNIQN